MKRICKGLFPFLYCLILATVVAAQTDRPGCKDHPLFTRMDRFYLSYCRESKFDQMDFRDEKGRTVKVEGKLSYLEYRIQTGGFSPPSSLQIIRNFENAIRKIGGVKVFQSGTDNIWLKLEKGGKVFYVYVRAPHGETYYLTVVEKETMAQEVAADAQSLLSDIQSKGSASVYGIYFDFNKADVKPESEAALKEVAKLLQENPTLKVYVVGHTDNVGGLDYNLKLSKARADAVIRELTVKYKISPDRLKAFGLASLAPVATNKTEEGRAKNRRVELVEQ